jgi:excisionase family DNA binding protein
MMSFDKGGFAMTQSHIDPVVPSDHDAMLAKAARLALSGSDAPDKALHVQINAVGREVTTFDLPPVVTRLLMDILKETEAGKAVSVVPVDAEVTTQQAAAILNVSRPYLVGMIDKGVLPARMVGNQRRLPLQDILAYKADNRAKRRETLRQMTALDQQLGIL